MATSWDATFDPAWYRAQFADVGRSGLDPRVHFETFGRRLGRPGNAAQAGGAAALLTAEAPRFVPYTDYLGTTLGIYPAPAFEVRPGDANAPSPALTLPAGLSPAPETPADPDLGVHLHLHYPALLEEMTQWLSNVPFAFHLYVSLGEAFDVPETHARLQAALPRATLDVRCFPNRGRDLAPFVAGFGEALLTHEYLAHIHGKRSPHSVYKTDWRRQLLANLMGHEHTVRGIFRCLQADTALGMVFPIYHHSLEGAISWGLNDEVAQGLGERLGLRISAERMMLFPAGSMFWARSAALRQLLGAGLTFDDFPAESGQVDATPAHALERLFGEIVYAGGYHVLQTRSERHYTDHCFDTSPVADAQAGTPRVRS